MNYKPPFWQFNGHLQTIFPSIFRKISVNYVRERIDLPDGDFLDLDFSKSAELGVRSDEFIKKENSELSTPNSKKLVIITHGLEGDSTRHYVTGMVRKFNENGYDALGWNCRSCSGEINRVARFYHHGDAEDLRFVVEYALQSLDSPTGGTRYQEVILVGFSMGGSLTLRLLGEKPTLLPPQVKAAIAVSVPLDLPTSVVELYKFGKRFYMERFLRKLGKKIKTKSKMFPENSILSIDGYEKIKNFHEFDGRYTAPLHGYESADDFYEKASVKPLLKNIKIPTLIIQAKNDPFLSPECLDLGEAKSNKNVHLEIVAEGGHVGFMQRNSDESYVENRAIKFASENVTD